MAGARRGGQRVNVTEQVRIGRTGVRVTRLGLGMAPIAGLYAPVGEEQARATVDRAWELGIRYFDTAPMYGNGRSERRGGAALAQRPRDEFTLSTKVGRLLRPGRSEDEPIWAEPADVTPVFDFSAAGVLTSYAESLDRLGLKRAEILHVHDPDQHFGPAVGEALPALVNLRDQGRIGAVSVGMNQAPMLVDFVRTGLLDCVLVAGRYTLLDQSAGAELLPLCAARGVSVIAAGVFNSGVLADPRPGATYNYRPARPGVVERARAIQAVCGRHGVPLRAAAIQFPLTHPAVSCVLVGARSPEEVADAVAMASLEIPSRLWAELGLLP
jgi:D-threo-aldose 1-dehydrogenase